MPWVIRKLAESDRDDVMQISKHAWEGHDFLWSVFDEWVRDPKCDFVGVVIDRRVVAVGNLRLVENGRTGWLEGLRVHPEFRGRGLANEITQFLASEGERLGVERLRYTTGSNNVESLKVGAKAGFSRVLELAVFWAIGLKKASSTTADYRVEEVNPSALYSLLRNNAGLISGGVLVYDWKALEFNPESVKEIGKDHRFFVLLKQGKVDSVSSGHLRPEKNDQPWWSFTVYASDSEGVSVHLMKNVKVALDEDLSSIMMTFEKRFEEAVRKLEIESEEKDTTHLVMLEKKIQPHS